MLLKFIHNFKMVLFINIFRVYSHNVYIHQLPYNSDKNMINKLILLNKSDIFTYKEQISAIFDISNFKVNVCDNSCFTITNVFSRDGFKCISCGVL